ncbi:peptidyl-tRNA hydrolase [Viridothelium virens]|uniref:peptidyl-tRNA hydrolase n=1 Tax=Viridothelium virens TaxID=1048519 RepID=A0A6A6HLK5_VIRVR|nr:peptidyl-tRNA hydrolase [Viridothelium virens]
MPPLPRPLLIASLGNPGSTYANTLHSAGHTLLAAIAQYLNYLPFKRERVLADAPTSRRWPSAADNLNDVVDWTLWQSPSLMNVSGRPVSTAWKAWQRGAVTTTSQLDGNESVRKDRGLLVLLHDELDMPLGQLKQKKAGVSARGHNGVRSVQAALPKTPFVRIAVGIGRPDGRSAKESGVIAKWVLKKMTREERERIEGSAGECVEILKQLGRG